MFGAKEAPALPVEPIKFDDQSSSAPRDLFIARANALSAGSRVLEVGTKQAQPGFSTHSQNNFPHVSRSDYVMVDVFPGADVDIVANIHSLPSEWEGTFQAFLAGAVFEHLERPWIAAKEVARVLDKGGFCYVATHQTFPLHGFPSDFFRFSKEALALIFEDAGMRVIECAYEHRAKISMPEALLPGPYQDQWNADWPSYIVVHLLATKEFSRG